MTDETPRPLPRNGARSQGLNSRPGRFEAAPDQEPVDLVAVQADDELINALAAGMAVSSPGRGGYDADDRVAAILAAWKAEVDADPIPELIDLDTAVATVQAAARPKRRLRMVAPIAAAAAFIALAAGGVSVGSATATPGDPLWGVSKVLYGERAESVEAAALADTHIQKAKEALVAGDTAAAARELASAEAVLGEVRPEEGAAELAEVQDFLAAKAAETPPGQAADLAKPLTSDPARKVPPAAATSPGTSPTVSPDPSHGSTPPGSSTGTGSTSQTPTPTRDPRIAGSDPGSDPSTSQPTADPSQSSASSTKPTPTTSATAEGTPDGGGGAPTASDDTTTPHN